MFLTTQETRKEKQSVCVSDGEYRFLSNHKVAHPEEPLLPSTPGKGEDCIACCLDRQELKLTHFFLILPFSIRRKIN